VIIKTIFKETGNPMLILFLKGLNTDAVITANNILER